MKKNQLVTTFVSFLTLYTIFTKPSQAFIESVNGTFPVDIVGFTKTYTDNLGGNLTGISLESDVFQDTSFTGDGTNSITANFFGGFVPANTPVSLLVEIQDPLGSETNIDITNIPYIIEDGVTTPLSINNNGGFICTTEEDGTALQAINRARRQESSGVVTQCQGNQVGLINNTDSSFTSYLSAQIIPDYQLDVSLLPEFLPRQQFIVEPGDNLGLLEASDLSQTTPEPSSLLGLLTITLLGLLRYFRK